MHFLFSIFFYNVGGNKPSQPVHFGFNILFQYFFFLIYKDSFGTKFYTFLGHSGEKNKSGTNFDLVKFQLRIFFSHPNNVPKFLSFSFSLPHLSILSFFFIFVSLSVSLSLILGNFLVNINSLLAIFLFYLVGSTKFIRWWGFYQYFYFKLCLTFIHGYFGVGIEQVMFVKAQIISICSLLSQKLHFSPYSFYSWKTRSVRGS